MAVRRLPTVNQSRFAILDRQEFLTRGNSISALICSRQVLEGSLGELPDQDVADLRHAALEHGPVYVVFSYSTPIAWALPTGALHIPPVHYSHATSEHQRIVYTVSGGTGVFHKERHGKRAGAKGFTEARRKEWA